MHSYKRVRDLAVLTLESCMKQYPAYAMQLLPLPLAALAKLPIPQLELHQTSQELSPEVLQQLRKAMREAAGSKGSPPSTPKGSEGATPSAGKGQPKTCIAFLAWLAMLSDEQDCRRSNHISD